jgi:hypothetical protein
MTEQPAPAVDLAAATAFMATHARLLDRLRFEHRLGRADPESVLAALAAYRNPDGGFGWGLEPDLRSSTSQPAGALHALDVLAELAPATSPLGSQLCDWLDRASLADGGLPFALVGAASPGTAPWWAGADPTTSSLHITAAVCAAAHRVAAHDPAVKEHRWLTRATDYCMTAIAGQDRPSSSYELRYTLPFLDLRADGDPTAAAELARLGAFLPSSGELPVEGGAEDEKLRPLDFSPWPDRPLRQQVRPEAIAADLERVAGGQRPDGGWTVDFPSSSPAGAMEWRGHATVQAITLLAANGRLQSSIA